MASGDPVVVVLQVMPPGANYATPDLRPGGSTPAESVTVWDFDGAADEYLDLKCRLVGYDGGGLTFTLPWSATSATSGNVRWGIAIRAIPDDAEDIDGAHTYDFNSVDDACASASGELSYPAITFTNGADMDSWANGELAIVRVRREASHANDTMNATDAELWDVSGTET